MTRDLQGVGLLPRLFRVFRDPPLRFDPKVSHKNEEVGKGHLAVVIEIKGGVKTNIASAFAKTIGKNKKVRETHFAIGIKVRGCWGLAVREGFY